MPGSMASTPAINTREALRTLRKDPVMARVIERVGPLRLRPNGLPSAFDALVRAITHQQLNGTAAQTILGRLCALFPDPGRLDPAILVQLPEQKLRGAGLSRAKVAAVRDVAAKTLDGTIPGPEVLRAMSDQAIIERLTQARGVGRWTVEMLLMFRLGRPDVLPVDDYGIRKGFARAYRKRALPKPKQLAKFGERWSPHRTAASWYLWRVLDLPPEKAR